MLINNLRSWGKPMAETSSGNSAFLLAGSLCTVYVHKYI